VVKRHEEPLQREIRTQEYKTPGTPNQRLEEAKREDKVPPEQHSRYRTFSLIKHSRPELAQPYQEVDQCLDGGATPAAYKEMLRLYKYVSDPPQTVDSWSPSLRWKDGKLVWKIVLFSDSDWAGDRMIESIEWVHVPQWSFLIVWRRAQKVVSLSSAEAEFYACSEAAKSLSLCRSCCSWASNGATSKDLI
jgi:hypothetical protein